MLRVGHFPNVMILAIGNLNNFFLHYFIYLIKGAKITLASHFDFEYVLGHKIAFLCLARGNPRPTITW